MADFTRRSPSPGSDTLLSASNLEWDEDSSRFTSHGHKAHTSRRQRVKFAGAILAAASLLAVSIFFMLPHESDAQIVSEEVGAGGNIVGPSKWLVGPPTQKYKDNLRNDTKYITSWIAGGWTNDVISLMNILYIAKITDRVPVMPPFAPAHMPWEAGFIDFGQVFDIPKLSASMGIPILEWWEIKDKQSTQLEDIGCWSIWATSQKAEHKPREVWVPQHLGLDCSYTPVPNFVKMYPNKDGDGDFHTTFWGLASITFPHFHDANLITPFPSETHKHRLPPDEQMVCYDFPYFVGATQPLEFRYDYSPMWRYVGRHTKWNPELFDLAQRYLRKYLQTQPDEDLPPYIAIHVRRDDFRNWCQGVPRDECFAPLSAYARRVVEIQEELRQRKGLEVTRIVVTSDEKDPAWWEQVRQRGWIYIDHNAERTAAIFGGWYPSLLDAVFLTSGVGLVGTDRSTMSLIAQRRLEGWSDGVTRAVKWGHKDADAH